MTNKNSNKTFNFVTQLIIMVVFQVFWRILRIPVATFLPENSALINAIVMLIMAVIIIAYARYTKAALSFRIDLKNKFLVGFSIIVLILLITAPMNFQGIENIYTTIYGCVATPLFEELLFRGYLWNYSQKAFSSDKVIFVISITMFALWHLGYMIPQLLEGNYFAVITKMIAGLVYGSILGFIRLKANNCYITMLVHSLLNLFMI